MKRLPCTVIVLLMLGALLLQKPLRHPQASNASNDASRSAEAFPPLVLSTSLFDSLPEQAVYDLGLSQVRGVKLRFHHGGFASYFHYTVDASKLLNVLARVPVPVNVTIADTTYRRMDALELKAMVSMLPAAEIENSQGFWQTDIRDFEIFECIKPPMRHIVLVRSADNHVLHRVTPAG
jgi:hypothetical protein